MSQVDSQLALCGATQEWHQYNLIHMLIMCKASLYKYRDRVQVCLMFFYHSVVWIEIIITKVIK